MTLGGFMVWPRAAGWTLSAKLYLHAPPPSLVPSEEAPEDCRGVLRESQGIRKAFPPPCSSSVGIGLKMVVIDMLHACDLGVPKVALGNLFFALLPTLGQAPSCASGGCVAAYQAVLQGEAASSPDPGTDG